jgi:hypothetical protein
MLSHEFPQSREDQSNSGEEKTMTSKRILGLAAVAIGILTVNAPQLSSGANLEQEQTARCRICVPKDWGEYLGAGSYGLEFRDDAGTIFAKQFPCGLEGAPNVSLEIHRK